MAIIALAGAPSAAGRYLHWGVIQISLTNLLIIAGIIVVFIAAIALPFPGTRSAHKGKNRDE